MKVNKYLSYEEHTFNYTLNVYPAKDGSAPYVCKNEKGEPYDFYQITDTKKSWRKSENWKRVVRRGFTRIDNKKKTLDQYDKDVLEYINQHYPLPS